MKLLSFIVPIYNSQKWLSDCLSSLLCQDIDYEEYEIICVDDGSTDNSLLIISDFKEKHPNVKVIKKSNSGVSESRNIGLANANGKYIWFVDSDDLIRENCLGFIKKLLMEYEPETVSFNVETVPEGYKSISKKNEEFKYLKDKSLKSYNNVWSSIISQKLIKDNNIHFLHGLKYGEDTLFQYYIYIYRKGENCSLTIKNSLYYYRQQSESAMHHKTEGSYDKHVNDLIEMARIYSKDYNKRIVDDSKKLNEVKMRQYMAIEGALAILPKSSFSCGSVLKDLTEEGLYPFPKMFWKVKKAKGLKNKLNAFLRMFFGVRPFYEVYFCLCKLFKV